MNPESSLLTQGKSLIRHKVTSNTIYQLIGKFFTAISGLITTHLVADYYGVTSVGDLTLIFTVVSALYLFIDFGLNAIVVKQMVENEQEEALLYRGLLGIRLIAAIILSFAAFFLVWLLPYNGEKATGFSPTFKFGVVLLTTTFFMQGIYLATTALFQKRLQYHIANLAVILGTVTTLVAFIIFTNFHKPFELALLSYVLGSGVTALIASAYANNSLSGSTNPLFSFSYWKKFLIPSLPIAATLVLNVIYFRADTFILAKLKPLSDVGIYGLAYRIFEQALVIPVFFVNALYPIMLTQLQEQPRKLQRTLWISACILLAGGLSCTFGIFVLGPWAIRLISSQEVYQASIVPLWILGAGLPFFFLSNLFLWLLVSLGKQVYLVFIYGAVMAVSIIGNLLFIPQYSYLASAALTTICEGLVLVLTMLFGLYFLKQKLRSLP